MTAPIEPYPMIPYEQFKRLWGRAHWDAGDGLIRGYASYKRIRGGKVKADDGLEIGLILTPRMIHTTRQSSRGVVESDQLFFDVEVVPCRPIQRAVMKAARRYK